MKKSSIKRQTQIRLGLTWLVIGYVSLLIIYPLVWTVGASLNPGNSLMSSSIIPKKISFEHYADLFNGTVDYVTWYWNSMKISFCTMVLTLIFVSFTAYSFSRFRFYGRKNGLILFLLLQMIPQFSALIAIFVLSQMLGLVNSHLALILIYVGGMIPMNTYLMKGYIDAIPRDLDESARMDGAGHFRIFIEIIMPLSKPIIAVIALFSFTCLISYYYEAETAAMYLFQGESKAKVRKVVTWIMRIAMPVLIFIWGNLESDIAWNLSDLALGSCTWVNMLIVLLLSPKVIALYKDYEEQMKAKKDPYYNPDKISWSGVDKEMWKDINKKYIENDK